MALVLCKDAGGAANAAGPSAAAAVCSLTIRRAALPTCTANRGPPGSGWPGGWRRSEPSWAGCRRLMTSGTTTRTTATATDPARHRRKVRRQRRQWQAARAHMPGLAAAAAGLSPLPRLLRPSAQPGCHATSRPSSAYTTRGTTATAATVSSRCRARRPAAPLCAPPGRRAVLWPPPAHADHRTGIASVLTAAQAPTAGLRTARRSCGDTCWMRQL